MRETGREENPAENFSKNLAEKEKRRKCVGERPQERRGQAEKE